MTNKNHYVSVKEMCKIDQAAVRSGIPIELMMENAGKALAFHIKNKFKGTSRKTILCVAGKGNNGGGVIASVRHLVFHGFKVSLLLLYQKREMTKPSRFHLATLGKNAKIIQYDTKYRKKILSTIGHFDVIIDGIFGTGFSGSVNEPIFSIIESIIKSKAYVVSNDIPSGINADTGNVGTICVNADHIVVLHKPKTWMRIWDLPTSRYSIESIGIP
ncbi:MAG: NAD(P)H-hydrate epimerase [Thaumarchaeota archaeon]|nr:NAD(P)H-hydrate epimerase [Nitrososphaerota archaeon]MDE1832143.1 NAD(P)H-hydrate epimerase [Nitrososphaerota archaeon]MDE1841598.1 NAD(P)H-hydrate epimerase [Nitrososphaerota archaeon]